MPLRRTRLVAKVSGRPRILFSILEKPNGELIVPIRTADRYGSPFGPRMLEQRYSIHPSPNSAEFTTIKQTINTADGKTETAVVLTDAVKAGTGFSIIFVRRVQDLTPTRYDLSARKKHDRTYILADIDADIHTLFVGVFIGHADTPFDESPDDAVVCSFIFERFKIVVLATARLIPSHYTTDTSHAITLPPQMVEDAGHQAVLRSHMQGKPPAVCLAQFRNSVKMLEKMIWQKALAEVDQPHLIDFINDKLRELESAVTLTTVIGGTDQRSVHMLSDGTPPSPQSPEQPPQFVRRVGRWED